MTRDFHREVTRVAGGLFSPGFGFGQVLCGLLFLFAAGSGCLEAEAVIAGFEDVAVMGQSVEQCSGHLGIAEHAGPFAEAEVRRDDDAGSLVEFAQQMEEQRPA